MASIADIVKDTAGGIYQTLYTRSAKKTPPDAAIDYIDYKVAQAGNKLWNGALTVLASGFGKGLLITAVAATTILALQGGVMAEAMVGPVATFGQGLAAGIGNAIGFLMSGVGLVTLAVGGTMGAVMEARKSYNSISAQVAATQAQNYEIARQLGVSKDLSMAKSNTLPEPQRTTNSLMAEDSPASTIPECGHCARELERRARETQQVHEARI